MLQDYREYSYKCLVGKEKIGLGGYAVVFTAKLSGESRKHVVEKLLDLSNRKKFNDKGSTAPLKLLM